MGKISLNNIAEELAAKSGITQEVADAFMRSFFETIEKGLKEDGMVKVKGFGTFKLQEMSERSSVDVNTGERILIKGHRRVSFTPDSAMKEFVNRPFAHFEPTELNDGYPEEEESPLTEENDDMEVEEDIVEATAADEAIKTKTPLIDTPQEHIAKTENIAEAPFTTETVVEEGVVEEFIAAETPVADELITEEPIATESIVEEPVIEESIVETLVADEGVVEDPVAEVTDKAPIAPVATEQKGGKHHRRGCLWGLLIILVLAAIVYGYFKSVVSIHVREDVVETYDEITVKTDLEEELRAEWEEVVEVETSPSVEKQETLEAPKTEPSVVQTASPAVKLEDPMMPEVAPRMVVLTESLKAKSVKDITPADTTDYVFNGTLVVHKLRSGETIIQLANKYYGDKRLWPYIVKYNQMKNFNSVAIGQQIKIPELKEK